MQTSSTLAMLGWFIIPDLATFILQTVYYRLTVPIGERQPLAGSPKYQQDKKRVYAFVIILYLVYSVVESVWNVTNPFNPDATQNSLYGILGLDPYVAPATLRSTFRRLSVQCHPDKATGTGPEVEERWLLVKGSYDVLSSPILRFAYDRFGEAALAWNKEMERNAGQSGSARVGMTDFIVLGVKKSSLGYYLASYAVLSIMAVFGIAKTGHIWRFYILTVGAFTELLLVTRSNASLFAIFPVLRWFGLTPYQFIQIMHSLIMTSFVALNKLGPLFLSSDNSSPISTKKGQETLLKQLEVIDTLTSNIAYESTQSLAHQMLPFQHDAQLVKSIKKQLADELIEKRLSEDIFMKDALSNTRKEKMETNIEGGSHGETAIPIPPSSVLSESVRKRK